MLTRRIPSTGEAIPAVGLGTWRAFMIDPDNQPKLRQLEEVTRIFFDSGGRLIDTAPAYGNAEEVVGRISTNLGIGKELFIATKVSTPGDEHAVQQMDSSFAKLRRERIDLMQIHNLADWQKTLPMVRNGKQQGRFRYIGVTHMSPQRFEDLERIVRDENVDFIQLPYSVGAREVETRLIPAARDSGVAILVMRPFDGGNLFERTRDKPVPDSVKPWADSWAAAFLKWILANEAITAVLPATSKPAHLRENVQSGFGRLPDADERAGFVKLLEL